MEKNEELKKGAVKLAGIVGVGLGGGLIVEKKMEADRRRMKMDYMLKRANEIWREQNDQKDN